MTSGLDLSQLAVNREPARSTAAIRRRNLFSRYVVPLSVLLGFFIVIGWSIGYTLLPATPVTFVPVLVTRAEVQQAGTPLFGAAGWVEPRPTPIVVSALTEGVVDKLLVTDGQEVKAGQVIARLIDADARIKQGEALAEIELKEAEVASAKATLGAARTNFTQPFHLQAPVAEAESALAKLNTELSNLPFALRSAQARQVLCQQDFEGKTRARDAIAGRALQRSKSELDAATTLVEELSAREGTLRAEKMALQQRCEALRKQLELKAEETRKLAEAEASLKAAEARLRQARLAAEAAKLRLDRSTICSPIDGRVLAVHAQPGKRLVGMNPVSERDASAVVSLYDPQMLQVRADVRLEDVPQIQIGQPVRIETAAVPGGMTGTVLTATSLADIQKNTLQVKIAIASPPAIIKPEMLVQVTFIAPESPAQKTKSSEDPLRLLVPRQLITNGEGGAHVWVADLDAQRARKQTITLGKAGTDDLIEVTQGLNPLDKLVAGGREGLEPGERIRVTGEDSSLGISTSGPRMAAASASANSTGNSRRN